MEELSLYIHIPFCDQKCNYCDFLSFSGSNDIYEHYFNALYDEIKRTELKGYIIKTIFIGGGTPSLVPSSYLVDLINLIKQKFNLIENAEITIEANPATFDIEKLIEYKHVGINRLSIGLQCWQDDLLKSIGRIHTQEDFIKSFNIARKAGFDNINVDLIFSLPNQTIDDWKETLEEVCSLNPEHISCYSLILEEGTPLYKWQEESGYEVDEVLDRKMYYLAIDYLKEKGFEHYEISNFAKKGYKCKHNLVYWDLKPYLGLGLGAHSYFNNYRFHNEENIKIYINNIKNNRSVIKEKSLLSTLEKKEEFIFMGLRKIEGISNKDYLRYFKSSIFDDYGEEIARLNKEGYIQFKNDNISLTEKGLDFANHVFMTFIT